MEVSKVSGLLWVEFVERRRETGIFLPLVLRATHTYTPPLSLCYPRFGINWVSVITPYIKTNNKSPPSLLVSSSLLLPFIFLHFTVYMHSIGFPSTNSNCLYQPFQPSLLFTICISVAAPALILCSISVLSCQLVLYRTESSVKREAMQMYNLLPLPVSNADFLHIFLIYYRCTVYCMHSLPPCVVWMQWMCLFFSTLDVRPTVMGRPRGCLLSSTVAVLLFVVFTPSFTLFKSFCHLFLFVKSWAGRLKAASWG